MFTANTCTSATCTIYFARNLGEHRLQSIGMHNTLKEVKLFCAFQNIRLDYNLGNHFVFNSQFIAMLFMLMNIW